MKATESQIERAKKTAEKSVLSFEKCLEMVIKQDLRNAPKQMTKKDVQKMESRNRAESGRVNFDFAERMKENSIKNLPSSMR
jgi:hypothetical protein